MGEAKRKAAAVAKGNDDPSANASFLREIERHHKEVMQSYEGDDKIRPTVVEAVDIEEALEYPVHGRIVAHALKIAELVAQGEATRLC
jgi:hypothetical protein